MIIANVEKKLTVSRGNDSIFKQTKLKENHDNILFCNSETFHRKYWRKQTNFHEKVIDNNSKYFNILKNKILSDTMWQTNFSDKITEKTPSVIVRMSESWNSISKMTRVLRQLNSVLQKAPNEFRHSRPEMDKMVKILYDLFSTSREIVIY